MWFNRVLTVTACTARWHYLQVTTFVESRGADDSCSDQTEADNFGIPVKVRSFERTVQMAESQSMMSRYADLLFTNLSRSKARTLGLAITLTVAAISTFSTFVEWDMSLHVKITLPAFLFAHGVLVAFAASYADPDASTYRTTEAIAGILVAFAGLMILCLVGAHAWLYQ